MQIGQKKPLTLAAIKEQEPFSIIQKNYPPISKDQL